MNYNDLALMFDGVSDDWKKLLVKELGSELTNVIVKINKYLVEYKKDKSHLCPPGLVMNAFRQCDVSNVKAVLVGQDPYIGKNEAMGMSFSVQPGVKIPPSLKNIFECLKHKELINEIPTSGDLTSWAKQGVLLINSALTTVLGVSNAHKDIWCEYTDKIIKKLSADKNIVFILLGSHAQYKKDLIESNNYIMWGHPSPLNNYNKTDNPKNFKYCNVFTETNERLLAANKPLINWDSICLKKTKYFDIMNKSLPGTATYIFTDGGSTRNGKNDCKASFAFYSINSAADFLESGIVKEKEIAGEVYKSSNIRGELTAILQAMKYITTLNPCDVEIFSDSEYCIKTITLWAPKWLNDPIKHKLHNKKNMDLIREILDIYNMLKNKFNIKITHVRSHQREPAQGSKEWFVWKGNDIVDYECGQHLR